MGYNKDNDDDTGFLGLDRDMKQNGKGSVYKIVKDVPDALRFPSENIYGSKNFGTPEQWLNFFKGEHELSSWSFHLVKVKGPKKMNS